jgi:hypothetical protein
MVSANVSLADGERLQAKIYKNGSLFKTGTTIRQGGAGAPTSQVIVMDDTVATDYWEVYWEHSDSSGTKVASGAASLTYFMGARIA